MANEYQAMPQVGDLPTVIGNGQPDVQAIAQALTTLQTTVALQQTQLMTQRTDYEKLIDDLNREVKKLNERNDWLARNSNSATDVKNAVIEAMKAMASETGGIRVKHTETKAEKVPNPGKFSGDRLKVDTFIAQLKNKFTADADKFPSEQHMLSHAYALLDGNAALRMTPFMNATSGSRFTTMKQFYDLLERSFGITNKHEYALEQLKLLRQKNQEFVVYLSEFENLIVYCDYSDEGKKDLLLQGLSRELKASLTAQPGLPATYQELVTLLTKLDSNIRLIKSLNGDVHPGGRSSGNNSNSQRNSGNSGNSGNTGSYGTARPGNNGSYTAPRSAPQPLAQAPAVGDPMDIDATKQAERQRRREQGLCYYCGSKDHLKDACTELARKRSMGLGSVLDQPATPKQPESEN
jgi:hypothetical protein